MRNIPSVLFEAMQRDHAISFLVVKIGPTVNGAFIAYTTLPYQFPYGGTTYLPDNGLLAIDPPNLSEVMDRDSYKLTISDPDFTLRATIESNEFTGATVYVGAGLINTLDIVNGGTEPGEAYDWLMTVYAGYLDNVEYAITPNEEISLNLEGSSPMGSFDLTRSLMTSRNYLDKKYPNLPYGRDTSYDQILIGSEKVNILWGRKEKK